MNPVQQAIQNIQKFGKGVDQAGANTYNAVRGATMGFDRFFGIPDNRMSPSTPQNSPVLGAVNTIANVPQDIGQGISSMFGKQQVINPLARQTSYAQTTPTPQVMAAATQAVSPTPTAQQPTNNNAFSGFTTTPVPSPLAPLIHDSAVKAGVDPNVFASLLFTEHGFQTNAGINHNTDGSYDRGIAQINSKAHPEISDQQAIDPSFAIPWAANLLGNHLKQFGDYAHAIAAYNVGAGGAANPDVFNNQGKAYLNKVAGGLSTGLLKQLGLPSRNK